MAIERYERKEAVDPRAPTVDFSGGQIQDASQQLRGLGHSLLETAEPEMRKRAIEAGTAAGGQAPMMRGSDGILRRADLPDQGGLYYGEAFKTAMNEIYKGHLLSDAEVIFEDIQTRNNNNPQQALIELRAHAEAVSATVPPDIKAEVEPILYREAIQRFNGLNSEKINRDNRQALSELDSQFVKRRDAAFTDLTTLAGMQDWVAYDAKEIEFKKFMLENQTARMGITGGLTKVGADGETVSFNADLFALETQVTSTKAVLDFIRQ